MGEIRARVNSRPPVRVRVLPSLLPKQVEFRKTPDLTMIQWRYVGEEWQDLIAVIDLAPTADDLLTLIKTVDGAGSGLDADLLDGLNSTAFQRNPDAHVQTITASGASVIADNTTLLRLALTVSGTVDLSFPATEDRDGAPLKIVDITGNATTVNGVFPSPDTLMGASGTVYLGGSSGAGIGMAFTLTLTPVSDESEWIV